MKVAVLYGPAMDERAEHVERARAVLKRPDLHSHRVLLDACQVLQTWGDWRDLVLADAMQHALACEARVRRRESPWRHVGVIALAVALACTVAVAAFGHTAPTGWSYDGDCCSVDDCAPLPLGRVTATANGWRVVLEPGDHTYVRKPIDVVVPYTGDIRLRRSQDEDFHGCVSKHSGRLICVYAPPMGF